jgi:hypothetical protein
MANVARIMTVSTTVALFCGPAFAQDVTYEVHRGQSFSELRTFAISEPPQRSVTASQPWWVYERAIDRQHTDAAVAAQLEARGFRRDDAHPDMYVTTHRTVRTKIWGYGWSGWGDDDWSHYGYGSDYLASTVATTLFIDVTSANTGELLWRGVGMRDMHFSASPKDRLERTNREVRKVFKDYPLGTVATSGRDVPHPTDR